jgi:probable F420-dependent oxidoreductase
VSTPDPGGQQVPVGFAAPARAQDVERLEQAGAAGLWVGGHVASVNPTSEPVVWLARLAEQTAAVRIGTATLLVPLYQPAVLAKQLADLDRAAGGRITLGVGVGGEFEADFAAAGVPRAERGSRADEAIGLLRQFWTAEPVTSTGRHYRYQELRIHPAPAQPGGPPIVISGRKPAAMRRAALRGDGWMPYLYSARRYAQSRQHIEEQAAAAGRSLASFRWLAYVMVALDDDPARARRTAAEFLGRTYQQDFDALLDHVAVAGAPDQVTERLQALLDAGADELIILPMNGGPAEVPLRLLAEVRPRLRRGDGALRDRHAGTAGGQPG